jgi:anti-sigma regulatory factor (Ser/Thr protein kinase)/FixJ family two-component response regulator
MGDLSRVGEARRHAAQLSAALGFDEVAAGRVALVVTELGTNLVKHARAGRLLLASREFSGGPADIEILSIDEGPGMGDVSRSMRDGFSTGGTPGTGLGAIKRLSDDFDVYSAAPTGTLIVSRVRARGAGTDSRVRFGVVAICAPGESVSGDGWSLAADGPKVSLLMADGLGHGPMAEEAAQAAVAHFRNRPFQDLSDMIQTTHGLLRSTRGAALAVARLDADASTIQSTGAGNVVTRVVSGTSDKTLLSQHGTVGLQIRKPEEVSAPWPAYAAVVMHTDGVMQRWPGATISPLLGRDPSLAAALLLRDFCRGRDDATVMVVRRKA